MKLFNVYKDDQLILENARNCIVSDLTGVARKTLSNMEINQTKRRNGYVIVLESNDMATHHTKSIEWQQYFSREWESVCRSLREQAQM